MTKRKDESSPNLTGTKSQKTDVAPESKPGETPLKAVAPLTPAPDQATQASEIKKKFSDAHTAHRETMKANRNKPESDSEKAARAERVTIYNAIQQASDKPLGNYDARNSFNYFDDKTADKIKAESEILADLIKQSKNQETPSLKDRQGLTIALARQIASGKEDPTIKNPNNFLGKNDPESAEIQQQAEQLAKVFAEEKRATMFGRAKEHLSAVPPKPSLPTYTNDIDKLLKNGLDSFLWQKWQNKLASGNPAEQTHARFDTDFMKREDVSSNHKLMFARYADRMHIDDKKAMLAYIQENGKKGGWKLDEFFKKVSEERRHAIHGSDNNRPINTKFAEFIKGDVKPSRGG
ncbi:MAG: hypothetical protein EBY16_05810 [Gammaproteobacteria bacterium]|nr:hypothetical protein [Gammaproteobacteria bacterium]